PECAPKRTSADHSELRAHHLIAFPLPAWLPTPSRPPRRLRDGSEVVTLRLLCKIGKTDDETGSTAPTFLLLIHVLRNPLSGQECPFWRGLSDVVRVPL